MNALLQRLPQVWREAVEELWRRRLRTLLTLLGMIFGVGAGVTLGDAELHPHLRQVDRDPTLAGAEFAFLGCARELVALQVDHGLRQVLFAFLGREARDHIAFVDETAFWQHPLQPARIPVVARDAQWRGLGRHQFAPALHGKHKRCLRNRFGNRLCGVVAASGNAGE